MVLDAELVAVGRDKNELRSFQELSTRARGTVSSAEVSSVVFTQVTSTASQKCFASLSLPVRIV